MTDKRLQKIPFGNIFRAKFSLRSIRALVWTASVVRSRRVGLFGFRLAGIARQRADCVRGWVFKSHSNKWCAPTIFPHRFNVFKGPAKPQGMVGIARRREACGAVSRMLRRASVRPKESSLVEALGRERRTLTTGEA